MQNLEQPILSQYANSPTMMQLIQNMNTYLDPMTNLDNFYNLIWNIETAQGYGLDVWGRILGVGRVLYLSSGSFFGFNEAGDANGFGQQAFYNGAAVTSNYSLGDPAYLTLLMAKALYNITDGSIPSVNQILLNLFPGLGGYVADGQNMTIAYTFTSEPTAVQLAIIEQSGVIPRATGVAASVAW